MVRFARRSPISLNDCSLRRAVDLVGDRWTLLILRAAFFGLRRFDDFHAELKAPRTVLSDRLKALTAAGVLERRAYKPEGGRTRHEYALTEMGLALQPALVMLTQWGDDWLGEEGRSIRFATRAGGRVRAALLDERGGEPAPQDLRVVIRAPASA